MSGDLIRYNMHYTFTHLNIYCTIKDCLGFALASIEALDARVTPLLQISAAQRFQYLCVCVYVCVCVCVCICVCMCVCMCVCVCI